MKGICYSRYVALLFFTFSCLAASAQNQASEQWITCQLENATLAEAFDRITQSNNLRFSYIDTDLPSDLRFSYKFDQIPLSVVLDILLRNTNLGYKLVNDYLIIQPRPPDEPWIPREFSIDGWVKDAESGDPLVGANVFVPGTSQGTTTDEWGAYRLTLPTDSVQLSISYVGYQTKRYMLGLFQPIRLPVELKRSGELSTIEVTDRPLSWLPQLPIIEEERATLTEAFIKQTPALLGEADPLHALDILPGVQAGTATFGGIHVRGAGHSHNLVLMDGATIYSPNHLLGLFSVFNSSAVQEVALLKGAVPAKYGRRLASVIAVDSKTGDFERWKGEGAIGLLSAKATVEGPLKKGKTSIMASGRRAYWDLLARPIIRNIAEADLTLRFTDLNLKIKHLASEKDQWEFSFYAGDDKFYYDIEFGSNDFDTLSAPDPSLNISAREQQKINIAWSNVASAVSWQRNWSEELSSTHTLSYSRYRFGLDFNITDEGYRNGQLYSTLYLLNYASGVEELGLHSEWQWKRPKKITWLFGANLQGLQYQPQAAGNALQIFSEDDFGVPPDNGGTVQFDPIYLNALETGVYGAAHGQWRAKWTWRMGVHFAGFAYQTFKHVSVQPRGQLSYRLGEKELLTANFSASRQYAHLLGNNQISLPTDMWVPATRQVRPQKLWQVGMGWEKEIGTSLQLKSELYYQRLRNISFLQPNQVQLGMNSWEQLLLQGKGRNYGWEQQLHYQKGTFLAIVSYQLAWAERQFPGINRNRYFPARYNRRHLVSAMVSKTFGPKFNLTAHGTIGSGDYITVARQRINNYHPTSFFAIPTASLQHINDFRTPVYHRVDINATFSKDKRRTIRKWVIGAFNVLNRKNYSFYSLNIQRDQTRRLEAVSIFQIIPSISYQLKWK